MVFAVSILVVVCCVGSFLGFLGLGGVWGLEGLRVLMV